MGKISDLPALERPRERALRYGIKELSDAELLALLINNGYKGASALDISHDLLNKYHGLLGLYETTVFAQKGISDTRRLSLQAAFELHRRISRKESDVSNEKIDAEYLYNRYKSELISSDQEQLILVIVNRHNHIVYECTLYKGTRDNIIFSYADIWKELVMHKAHAFYLIHNHPSLPCQASKEDELITKELIREAKRQETPLLDHIIIGRDGYYSFKKEKIIDFSY